MKTKAALLNNKSSSRIFDNKLYNITLNTIKFNFKRFLYIFFGLRKFNSNIYFIGFSDLQYSNFSKLFKFFNIKYFKDNIWITGLLSNSRYTHKFLKIKRLDSIFKKKSDHHVKDFYKILKDKKLPDLLVFYERKPYTKYIIKECLKLKIPVIILFDVNIPCENNLIKVFHYNLKKEIFTKYLFQILKVLLKREKIIEKKNIERRKKNMKKYNNKKKFRRFNSNNKHKQHYYNK